MGRAGSAGAAMGNPHIPPLSRMANDSEVLRVIEEHLRAIRLHLIPPDPFELRVGGCASCQWQEKAGALGQLELTCSEIPGCPRSSIAR